ncbi:MAG: gamma-glutamylcyclotransferase family protein [Chloroflexota bacterium]
MRYFAYGSNLNKKQMQERCPDSKPLFTAVLPNYKLIFIGWSRQWKGAVASIKASRGDRVRGAVYEVSEQCLRKLDRFEGYPQNYNRLKVIVFGEDDEAIEAIIYIKAGQIEEDQPSKEYLAVIQQGLRDWRLF